MIEYDSVETGSITYNFEEANCLNITLRVVKEEDIDHMLDSLRECVGKYRDKIIPAIGRR